MPRPDRYLPKPGDPLGLPPAPPGGKTFRRWDDLCVRFDGAVRLRASEQWSIGPRWSKNLRGHCLIHVWSGRGWIYDGKLSVFFNPGSLLWLCEGKPYFAEVAGETFDATFAHFELLDGNRPGALPLPRAGLPPALLMPCPDGQFLAASFMKLAHWTLLRMPGWRSGGAALVKSLLYELHAEAARGAPEPADRLTMKGRRWFKKPLDKMRARALAANPHSGSAWDELTANHDRISKGYFSVLFHREMGLSQREWTRRARMLFARWHLGRSTMEIGELGKRLGFKTGSEFSRWFGTYAGCTPQEFRKRCDARGAAVIED